MFKCSTCVSNDNCLYKSKRTLTNTIRFENEHYGKKTAADLLSYLVSFLLLSIQYHATIGKLSGELLRDLADSKILPFNMSDYTTFLRHYTHRFQINASIEIGIYNLNMSKYMYTIDCMYCFGSFRYHNLLLVILFIFFF